jgi:hypothetical protein
MDPLSSILWIDRVDVGPGRLNPSMLLPDLNEGVAIIEDVVVSDKNGGGFNDWSEWSLDEDTLVRRLGDNRDGFCGYGAGFPDSEREIDVNPDVGEELKGMSRIGYWVIEEKAGFPLRVCSNSGTLRAKGLDIGVGALRGGKPVDPVGIDKVRPDGRAPPGTPAALDKVGLRGVSGRVFPRSRETFELLRIAGMTENITYMNVCPEWFHEFLTLKGGI